MGREQVCVVRAHGGVREARALLETDELIVRGEPRVRLPFGQIGSAEVRGDTLVLQGPDGAVELDLGEREARRWAERIRNPPTLRKRLGLTDGASVALIGEPQPALGEALAGAPTVEIGRADAVFASIEDAAGLGQVPALAAALRRDAALWIAYPKGRAGVREGDVLAAGRAAKLTDTRVARVSETHTALRFVVRRADR